MTKKIIISSQDFGYGATTQMFALLKHLFSHYPNQIQVDILYNKPSEVFYQNFIKFNTEIASKIALINSLNAKYDLYVGIYDPFIIFEGVKQQKKTIFLCNLGFLRSPDQGFVEQFNAENFFKSGISETNHHNNIIAAFLMADNVFMRISDHFPEGKLFNIIKSKTTFIGPIIYPQLYSTQKNKEKIVIFQCGGQVNPLSSPQFYSQYFLLIKQITAFVKKNGYKIIVILNPMVQNVAQKILSAEYSLITTLAQEEYQKLLATSTALFSPFGINTFYESSYYNIPTFILPEQHLGHIKSINRYLGFSTNIKNQSFLVYNKYHDEEIGLDVPEKVYIKYLEKKYRLLNNSFLDLLYLKKFLEYGENLVNKHGFSKLINKDIHLLLNKIRE